MPGKSKKRSLKQAELVISQLKEKIARMSDHRDTLREALVDLLDDVFVGKDEAGEIARDAVSERIW